MNALSKGAPAGRKPRIGANKLGCCLAVPSVLALSLLLVYKYTNRPADIIVPTHAVPADNGWNYLHQASVLANAMKHKTPYDMTSLKDYTLVNFSSCAIDSRPVLKVMQQALTHPFMGPPVRTAAQFNPSGYAEVRDLERINAGAADYFEIAGDAGHSMELHLNGLEIGVLLARGGGLLPDLVGMACESIAASRIEQVLPRLNKRELKRSADQIQRIIEERTPISEVIVEEGYTTTAVTLSQLNNPENGVFAQIKSLVEPDENDASVSVGERAEHAIDGVKYAFKDKHAMLLAGVKWHQSLALALKQPYSGRINASEPNGLLDGLSSSGMLQLWSKHASNEARVAVLRGEIALYRYKAEYHRYPPKLADLCPQFLPSIPLDPCGGAANVALTYRLKSDGSFLLYSLGPDLVDNGGTPAKYVGAMGGDIVAGQMYKNGPILYSPGAKIH